MVNTFAILTCILRKKETDSRYINLVQMHRFPYGTLVVGIAWQKFKLYQNLPTRDPFMTTNIMSVGRLCNKVQE